MIATLTGAAVIGHKIVKVAAIALLTASLMVWPKSTSSADPTFSPVGMPGVTFKTKAEADAFGKGFTAGVNTVALVCIRRKGFMLPTNRHWVACKVEPVAKL